jgi:hypothetical protein
MERHDLVRHETMLLKRGRDQRLLCSPVRAVRQMLHGAAAAGAEMGTDGRRTLARRQHLQHFGRLPLAARWAEPGSNAIARRGEWQINRPAAMKRDAITARANAVDNQRHFFCRPWFARHASVRWA